MTPDGLAPEAVWRHFADLSAIPRASHAEGPVLAHLQALADRWGLPWRRDEVGNLVIRKPGRGSTPVILQAHVDMVGEQDAGGTHDFSRDPIEWVVEDGWVKARGTTLGADDGVGVAAILAILKDPTLDHGPLEALFTVDEEGGMTGAAGLDPTLLSGSVLLNLDGEGSGRFQVGSAGGATTKGRCPVSQTRADAPAGWQVRITGLVGGHSGVEIHRQGGNALGLAARFASEFLGAQAPGSWQLVALDGGDKDNAIPREARLVLAGPVDGEVLRRAARAAQDQWSEELGPEGPHLRLVVEGVPRPSHALTPASQRTLLDVLSVLPDGVQSRSKVVAGLVETSANLAKVGFEDGQATIVVSLRSSSPGQLVDLGHRVAGVFRLAGGTTETSDVYPPWSPNPASRLKDEAPALWTRVTGTPAVVEVVHAGLECGLLAQKLPGVDLISFGPELVDIHTPRERVEVVSVDRFYRYLVQLLGAL